jgi:hypothetical protein
MGRRRSVQGNALDVDEHQLLMLLRHETDRPPHDIVHACPVFVDLARRRTSNEPAFRAAMALSSLYAARIDAVRVSRVG